MEEATVLSLAIDGGSLDCSGGCGERGEELVSEGQPAGSADGREDGDEAGCLPSPGRP